MRSRDYKRVLQKVLFDDEQKKQLLRLFHDGYIGGHRGIESTYKKIHERFWWPNMFAEIEKYVKSCLECQMFSKKKFREPMTVTVSSEVMEKIHIDVVTMYAYCCWRIQVYC